MPKQEQLIRDIALTSQCIARLLDQAEPEDKQHMEDVTVVCSRALKHIADLSEKAVSNIKT